METIFKVGDKVFDYQFGWGKVINDNWGPKYPIEVQFNKSFKWSYTKDGRIYDNCINPTLSLTEYTLEGFSQEKLPKKGDIVWVRDHEDEDWAVSHFLKKEAQEREQLMEAWINGDESDCLSEQDNQLFAEDFYNKTYKQQADEQE